MLLSLFRRKEINGGGHTPNKTVTMLGEIKLATVLVNI